MSPLREANAGRNGLASKSNFWLQRIARMVKLKLPLRDDFNVKLLTGNLTLFQVEEWRSFGLRSGQEGSAKPRLTVAQKPAAERCANHRDRRHKSQQHNDERGRLAILEQVERRHDFEAEPAGADDA